jgi:hypothetical protein
MQLAVAACQGSQEPFRFILALQKSLLYYTPVRRRLKGKGGNVLVEETTRRFIPLPQFPKPSR